MILILTTAIGIVAGKQCYSCATADLTSVLGSADAVKEMFGGVIPAADTQCGDAFDAAGSSVASFKHDCAGICMKAKHDDFVWRYCMDIGGIVTKCQKEFESDAGGTTMRCCDTDLCNGSPRIILNYLILLFSVILTVRLAL
jgi:hypothetical protein